MGISLQDATAIGSDNAIRTQYGLILPPGARVAAYVRSTGVQSGDYDFLATNLVPTLAQGLARVRAGLGDFVICLPGHVENVDAAATTAFAANLVSGTKIIGIGSGSNTPTFSWTVAGSQWAVTVPDVVITGLRLKTSNLANTTLAITVSADDFKFYFNEVETGSATANAVVVMSITGTANRFDISGNVFRDAIISSSTDVILISSTGSNGRICDNEIMAGSTTGPIRVSGVAVMLKILRNVINNIAPASVAGIVCANVAITGHCAYNTITVLSTGAFSAGVTGITVGGVNNLMGFFQNFAVNDPNKSGLLVPAVDT